MELANMPSCLEGGEFGIKRRNPTINYIVVYRGNCCLTAPWRFESSLYSEKFTSVKNWMDIIIQTRGLKR